MSVYFLDSSAILKRYLDEVGSEWVRQTVAAENRHRLVISQITMVEVNSGFSRRKREGRISERTASMMRLLLDRHAVREYEIVGFTRAISQTAVLLVEHHPLRAYDAVQLASALFINQQLPVVARSQFMFVSADVRLLNVASEVGLQALNPTTQN